MALGEAARRRGQGKPGLGERSQQVVGRMIGSVVAEPCGWQRLRHVTLDQYGPEVIDELGHPILFRQSSALGADRNHPNWLKSSRNGLRSRGGRTSRSRRKSTVEWERERLGLFL